MGLRGRRAAWSGVAFGILLALAALPGSALAQRFFERGEMYDSTQVEADVSLQKMLKQFPAADANKDGVLTLEEAQAYHFRAVPAITAHFREAEFIPEGVTRWMTMVPMRDGFELPTAVYFPAGKGPWGAIVSRGGGAGTQGELDIGDGFLAQGFVFVQQGTSGPGVPSVRRDTTYDAYDCIEWIARQPWSNGKVGTMGYSAGGMQWKRDVLTNPPHLTVCINCISCSDRRQVNNHGGVPSGGRGRGPGGGWNPGTNPFSAPNPNSWAVRSKDLTFPTIELAGWFDVFAQGQFDDWQAMRHTGKAVLVVGCGGHGALDPSGRLCPPYGDCDIFWPYIPGWKWLSDSFDGSSVKPTIYYFLMGDCVNPNAPGNVWKVAHDWPIPNAPTSYYMTKDGGLQLDRPSGADDTLSYDYDPNDPVPSIGGIKLGVDKGPLDQRPLDGRKDILRFQTEPLKAPVEITGRLSAELYISTDVPDTDFIVQLIDVYPDGYQWLARDSAARARYFDGPDKPQPLEKGKVYKLTVDLYNLALVVDKGHRIAVHVMSSDTPLYQVHPNSYEPVDSYDGAPIAHQTLYLSGDHASRLILPVVQPGVSQDFVP